MTKYVAGFLFDNYAKEVVLIRKQKPPFMFGKLNAVGGKLEDGELPLEGMVREFYEETGLRTYQTEWKLFCSLWGKDFNVQFFTAYSDDLRRVCSRELERVGVYPIANLREFGAMRNLRWLIEMALAGENDCWPFNVWETY